MTGGGLTLERVGMWSEEDVQEGQMWDVRRTDTRKLQDFGPGLPERWGHLR